MYEGETPFGEHMTARLESTSEEIADNRVLVAGMADDAWTKHIIERCANDGNTALDASVDSSEISIEGDDSSVTFESDLYNKNELFIVKMSIINSSEFWSSDTATSAEVQANILADSGYTYPEIEEALALVDYDEAKAGVLPAAAAQSWGEQQ